MPGHLRCIFCRRLVQCSDQDCIDCVWETDPFCVCNLDKQFHQLQLNTSRPLLRIEHEKKFNQHLQDRADAGERRPPPPPSLIGVVNQCLDDIAVIRNLTGSSSEPQARRTRELLTNRAKRASMDDSATGVLLRLVAISGVLRQATKTFDWIEKLPAFEVSEERHIALGFASLFARTAEYHLSVLLAPMNTTPTQQIFGEKIEAVSTQLTNMIRDTSSTIRVFCPGQTRSGVRHAAESAISAALEPEPRRSQSSDPGNDSPSKPVSDLSSLSPSAYRASVPSASQKRPLSSPQDENPGKRSNSPGNRSLEFADDEKRPREANIGPPTFAIRRPGMGPTRLQMALTRFDEDTIQDASPVQRGGPPKPAPVRRGGSWKPPIRNDGFARSPYDLRPGPRRGRPRPPPTPLSSSRDSHSNKYPDEDVSGY